MPSSLFRGLGDTGPAFSMHGAQADREIRLHSDLHEQTGPLNVAYTDIARSFARALDNAHPDTVKALAKDADDYVKVYKAIAADLHRRAGTSSSDDTGTEIGQINHVLRKCRTQLSKAEAAVEDDEPEDTQAAIDSAQKLLGRAKKMIAVAQEDVETEEDDSAVEASKASYKKAAARLADLKKSKPAPAAAATAKAPIADAKLAKATAELDAQCEALRGGLAEAVALLHQHPGVVHAPRQHIMKAANDGPAIPTLTQINDANLTTTDTIQCKVVRNLLTQGAVKEAQERLKKSSSDGVRTVFTDFI